MKDAAAIFLILTLANFFCSFAADFAAVDFNILTLFPKTQNSVSRFSEIVNNTWIKTYSTEYDYFTRCQIWQINNTSTVYELEWWSSYQKWQSNNRSEVNSLFGEMAGQLTQIGINFTFSRATYVHHIEYDFQKTYSQTDSEDCAAADIRPYFVYDSSKVKDFMDAHKEAAENYLMSSVDFFMGYEFWTNETNESDVFVVHWYSSYRKLLNLNVSIMDEIASRLTNATQSRNITYKALPKSNTMPLLHLMKWDFDRPSLPVTTPSSAFKIMGCRVVISLMTLALFCMLETS